ncbi:ribosome silencing factor [Desulfovibrio sp. MES5]|uniref:ribosome silencing factor n=1 Tax=Desulfovibrio sp. MES5 TaxID=1899016 RepID=UPI0025C6F427|nr:ribosome silencing factor [Desulfovibrio sp. MES5]
MPVCPLGGLSQGVPEARQLREVIALDPALRYVLAMENNHPNTPSGGSAPKQFSEVPASRKAADVVQWLEEHKALRVVCIDLEGQVGFADALIIASAGSVRHAQSLADGVSLMCREKNYEFLRTEGYATGQWILVDMNDVIVNIFQEPVRELYALEALWGHGSGAAQTAGREGRGE